MAFKQTPYRASSGSHSNRCCNWERWRDIGLRQFSLLFLFCLEFPPPCPRMRALSSKKIMWVPWEGKEETWNFSFEATSASIKFWMNWCWRARMDSISLVTNNQYLLYLYPSILYLACCQVTVRRPGAVSGPAFCMTLRVRVRVRVRFCAKYGVIIILCTKRWSGEYTWSAVCPRKSSMYAWRVYTTKDMRQALLCALLLGTECG